MNGCFQELVSINAMLQYTLDKIKKTLETDTIVDAHNKILKIIEKI